MFTVITADQPQAARFDTRTECIQWVRENIDPMDTGWSIKEDAKPCRECGEPCESTWSSYCKSCQFSLSEAVKASRKVIRSAKRNGNPVVSVWNGEDEIKGKERELLEAVHSVDQCHLYTESGAWVFVVAGNESEADCIVDYNVSLEAIIEDANLKDD